jgi:hypothetical protein
MSVIDATDRFAGDPGRLRRCWPGEFPPNVINAVGKFERPWTLEDLRARFCPAMKLLPFVVMQEDASLTDHPLNWWCDEPTKHSHVDFKRGRVYAQLLLKAIKADLPNNRASDAVFYLERIFAAMVDDAIRRRLKGGKGSRLNISSTVSGFLSEISRYICGVPDPLEPAA